MLELSKDENIYTTVVVMEFLRPGEATRIAQVMESIWVGWGEGVSIWQYF